MAMVNDNAYKLNLPGEYNISITFNVSDLLLFDFKGKDSRVNPFEEGGSDAYGHTNTKSNSNLLNYDGGPITRFGAKRIKDAAKELVQRSLEPLGQKEDDLEETKLVNFLSCD